MVLTALGLAFFSCSRPPAVPRPQPSQIPVIAESVAVKEYVDLNTVLMESTFRLQGITEQDSVLIGTVFIFDLPC